ncbi:MAG: 1-phosphofructokinase family hexose kinase [Gaiellaceae bacterium]|jgi:1-phosphofructokinase/tagatose 6-phosphate kinase
MLVTVTLNAAVDRTLTVPNFQRGLRHRASQALTLAGGKGINIARALKALGVPVVATGLAGGRTGTRIVEELTHESILNDFVRIEGESRTSTAVVDPMTGSQTEINEWGPHVEPEELQILLEKLLYLSADAEWVIFAGTLPRGVGDSFYAEAIKELSRRHVQSVLDSEGTALRLGVEAEPYLVSPNQHEAESLIGQEFSDEEDFVMALETIAEMGARNILISHEGGCYALLKEERKLRRYRVAVARVDPVSPVGSGDVLLAGFLAARRSGRSLEEALRLAVGAATASTLETGAGRFDAEQAAEFARRIEITELQPVATP